jgi:hypothetical protein
MPDFSMCEGGNCPQKQNCKRYTAKPDYWQSYTSFEASYTGEPNCEQFKPTEKTK